LATEINKRAIEFARRNLLNNQITNACVARLAAHEVRQALEGVRQFYRLKDIDLANYNFASVLVDPPRSGLDFETVKFVQNFRQIIYISCNPQTLQRDLAILNTTHQITDCALFDQFPFTNHIECAVILKIR